VKKILVAAALLFVPITAFAQIPGAELFHTAADRLGMPHGYQERVMRFAEALQGDAVAHYAIASVYPPAVDIVFASGREIHARGSELSLRDYDDYDDYYDDWYDWDDYAGPCTTVFILGYLLTWIGFFNMAFQLFLTGIELIFFALALCL